MLLAEQLHLFLRAFIEELNVGKGAVRTVLIDKMNWTKVCLWFVSHFPTDKHQQVRLASTRNFVETAEGDPNFLKSIITGDESCCYIYDPQTKWQSTVWLSLGASRPTKVRQQKSKVKTLLIVFFDAKGLLHHKFIPPGQTVTSIIYLAVMKRLMCRICQIRLEYRELGSWSLLHETLPPAHTATLLTHYYAANQITVLYHPHPNSSDLAAVNFFFASQNQVGDERLVF